MIAKIIGFWSVSGLFTELRVWMDPAPPAEPDSGLTKR